MSAESEIAILHHRVTGVESTVREAISEIRDGIREIAENTGKLAVLEERHAETRDGLVRAFAEIDKLQAAKCDISGCRGMESRVQQLERQLPTGLEQRLHGIELAMPALKEARKWLVAGVLFIVGIVGAALVALVVSAK